MKKNLMALMFALIASSGIANAGTTSNTTQVDVDFVLVGQCSVTGDWNTYPLPVTNYPPFGARLGTLTIKFTGSCNGKPYMEGIHKDSGGSMQAIGPRGSTVTLIPQPNGSGLWWRDYKTNGGLYYYDGSMAPNGTVSVVLTNDGGWNPEAGRYSTVLLIGTYSI